MHQEKASASRELIPQVMPLLEQDLRWKTTELIWMTPRTEYLGWIKGPIATWYRSKGYLVNFEHGDQEWLQSVEEQDVRLFEQYLIEYAYYLLNKNFNGIMQCKSIF